MKILHLDSFTGFGGGQKRYSKISRDLKALGHEMVLVSREKNKVRRTFPGKCYTASFLGDLDLFSFIKIFYIILKEKPDIINTHSHQDHWIGGILSKLFKNIKLVHTRHVDFKVKNNFINKFIYKNLTDFIITSCKKIKDTLISSFPDIKNFDKKIFPVLTLNIPEKKCEKNIYKESYNINQDTKIVSMITRLVSWKGHEYFLKAIPLITREINNVKFLIAGKGPFESKLRELVKKMEIGEYVIFTGFIEDVENLYCDSYISVLPSEMESPGVSIAESIFYETPVITSRVGGIPEIVEDGYNGFLIEVGDFKKIAEVTIKLLKNEKLYKKIKENCRNWKQNKLKDKTPAEKTLNLYRKFLNVSSSN
ncbi:MAG TPA: glycosyltransferase family 4 protein [Candidatus Mcinerneyibacterium sp.]|nr:glycosyltransferase family 4 protein [Candidatus Mcinerneyibacterium sp.]